jgi:pimeloyl-ACP methyl ester carboxylesterase
VQPKVNKDQEKVIVIHGYASHALNMEPLRYRLSRHGFDAVCWSYPSLFGATKAHAVRLRRYLDELDDSEVRYHILAHSMGSVVTRAALLGATPQGLGRVVFVTPPISGSPIARLAPKVIKWLSRPVKDMSNDPESFVNSLPPLKHVDVGIIAARFDVLVPQWSSRMSTQCDYVVLPTSHNSLLYLSQTADLAAAFLRTGRFKTETPAIDTAPSSG